jgi:hypothetical protein
MLKRRTKEYEKGRYEGEILPDGRREGWRKMMYVNEDIYEGDYKNDKRRVKGKLFILMELFMKEIGRMIKRMVEGNLFLVVEIFMKEVEKIINGRVEGN